MNPKRIDLSLLTADLRTLINASAKIFPMHYADISTNNNPDNYEYVRCVDIGTHRNEIYHWEVDTWELIGADDRVVDFESDITNKPTAYPPSAHNHDSQYYTEGEVDNKLANKVDKVEGKGLSTNDYTSADKQKLDSLSNTAQVDYSTMNQNLEDHKSSLTAHSNKADKSYVDTELAKKADSTALSGHTGNTTVHVTQTDKDTWNSALFQKEGTNVATYYRVAEYSIKTATTGTMKIALPKGWGNTMLMMEIDIYNYASGTGYSKVLVSGYAYSTTPAWINTSAKIIGHMPKDMVRLGYDGTKCCILLGDTTTTWTDTHIVISKVEAFWSGYSDWLTGWAIAPIASESTITNIVRPELNAVTIGTTAPTSPQLNDIWYDIN